MPIHYVYPDGSKVPVGVCVRPIGVKTTMTIEIESLHALSPSVIKNHLKKFWDCRSVQFENEVVTVAKP